MRKENKNNHENKTRIFATILGVISVIGLISVIIAIWLQITVNTDWQLTIGYMFILYAPLIYAVCLLLFVGGVILLVQAVRRHNTGKVFRIVLATLGLIFILPGSYIAYGFGSYYYVKFNAERISADKEVLQLVEECKVMTVRREYVSWDKPADQRQSTAAVYLKDSAKSDAERKSYFYSYRSFRPEYYDELAKVALSNEVTSNCGSIKLYDEQRENIPITYIWASKEETLEVLQTCKIQNIFTTDSPSKSALEQASNAKSASTNIFIIMDPISEGYAGKLYIKDADQNTRSSVLDFAKTKKGSCMYKQPNIDGVE